MKNHLTKSIGLMAFVLAVASCVPGKKEKTVVNIISKTQASSEVKFFHRNNLEETILALSKTDSLGHCSFEVDLQRPVLATIMIGEKYGEVYLVPEGNLTINESGKAYTTPLTFSGDGKTINNCLSWFNSAFERIRWGRVHPPTLNQDEYVKRLDSLKAIFTDFKEQYQDSITLSDSEWALLETKSKMKVLEFEQEYHFYKYNDLVREKFGAIRSGKAFEDLRTPKEAQPQPQDIPFDSSYLSYSDYQTLLNFY